MKRILLVLFFAVESMLTANANQLNRAVKVAKELHRQGIAKNVMSAQKNKQIDFDLILELKNAGLELEDIASSLNISLQDLINMLAEFQAQHNQPQPGNADDWLADQQAQQDQVSAKINVGDQDGAENGLECMFCQDMFTKGSMYTCDNKHFLCDPCLREYQKSLKAEGKATCPMCRKVPWKIRKYDVSSRISRGPEFEVKPDLRVIRQKEQERKARLYRGNESEFNRVYDQYMNGMLEQMPSINIEVKNALRGRAQKRYNADKKFELFVQDIADEIYNGKIYQIEAVDLLLPTLLKLFDSHYNGQY